MQWLHTSQIIIFTIFISAFSVSAQTGTVALLKPAFQTGKTYRFITQNDILMEPPGETPRRINLEQHARYDVKPGTIDSKGAALRGYTEKLAVTIQSGQKTMTYDSLAKNNQQTTIGKHFESTVNRYVDLELDEKLKILSQNEGGRSVGATPLPNLPRFGPEELVQLINSLSQGYSPDPVSMGDEWVLKGKRPVGDLGELGFEISYKNLGLLKFEEHDCMVIEFRGQISGDITDENQRNVDFQGSRITGSLVYDPALSMTRYSEHNMGMILKIPKGDGSRQAVPMEQRVILKLVNISDKK
jgi:hypothetical protein